MTRVSGMLLRMFLVSFFCILFFASHAHGQFSPMFSYQTTRLNMNVDHMPLRIRDIPIHKNDTWVSKSKIAPIKREEYGVENWIQKIGIGCDYESSKYIVQAQIFVLVDGQKDIAERNYTNDVGGTKRGEGAALTFCKFKMGGFLNNEDGKEDMTAELSLRRKLSEYINLGASVSYVNALAFNGWDRWDSQERKETFILGHILPTTVFFEGRYKFISLYAGATFFPCIYGGMGKDAGLRTNDIGFSCGVSLIILKK